MKPIQYKKCKNCQKDFPYRESNKKKSFYLKTLNIMLGSARQVFCSKGCSTSYRNKYNNPSKLEKNRKILSMNAKKRGVFHMHTKSAHDKRIKTISGSGHWNWQGGKSHPLCIDCDRVLSFRKTRCIKCNAKYRVGDKSANWKGGVSRVSTRIRMSPEGIKWRKAVFKRDNYTCLVCKKRNGNGKSIYLQADHIKPFALYPELRFCVDNGRTLCIDCHKKTDTYGHNFFKYLKEFKKLYPNHPYFSSLKT